MSVFLQDKSGIVTLDTECPREQMVSSHLILEHDEAAFVDVGTTKNLPQLLEALVELDIKTEEVTAIFLTHIHLDHAGAAGTLMAKCPNAKLIVHPRGARHMVDPSLLIAGSKKVYGAEVMKENYGEIRPVPEERVVIAEDNFEFDLAGRILKCVHTPGHAKHHYCLWDQKSESFFTGDTFGLAYPEFTTEKGPLILPTTTPIHFDPEALEQSILALMSYAPKALFLTHFGRVEQPKKLAPVLIKRIKESVSIAMHHKSKQEGRYQAIYEAMMKTWLEWAKEHGVLLEKEAMRELLHMDVDVNTQGLEHWLNTHVEMNVSK